MSPAPQFVKITGTVPPWAAAAAAALELDPNDHVELGTHRQEKERTLSCAPPVEAGFTCPMCPQPYRAIEGGQSLPDVFVGKELRRIKRRGTLYTKRCTSCNSAMARWQKAQKLGKRILNLKDWDKSVFVAFVTLTIPNIPQSPERLSLQDEAKSLKRRVASFRRRAKYRDCVIGGVDVVENTVRPNGDWNLHHHGIWVMTDYYDQRELQDDWGHRVRIEKVRKPHAVLKYLTAYVSKSQIEDVRCLETFGYCRGRAASAVEDSLLTQRES